MQVAVAVARRALADLPRRVRAEALAQAPHLLDRWPKLAAGLVFQYVHGVAGQMAHRMHRPGPTLYDLGFEVLPDMGEGNHHVSEWFTALFFASFALWLLSPFYTGGSKAFHAVVVLDRGLQVVCACQALRMCSFLVTGLPAPAHHCRTDAELPTLPAAETLSDVLLIDVARQSGKGCGDLIFSSHTTFALAMALVRNEYGANSGWVARRLAFAAVAALSLLIIASRKHYTVDIVVAWYTVPLVHSYLGRHFAEPSDRTQQLAARARAVGQAPDEGPTAVLSLTPGREGGAVERRSLLEV